MLYLLGDVVCDFTAIYRIRIDPDTGDFAGLTGPQFARYASRLPLYDGAVRRRLAIHHNRAEPEATAQNAPALVPMLDATPLALTTNPLLRHFIEYGQPGGG